MLLLEAHGYRAHGVAFEDKQSHIYLPEKLWRAVSGVAKSYVKPIR